MRSLLLVALGLILCAHIVAGAGKACVAKGTDRVLTRKIALDGALKYIDTNHDKCISRTEAEAAQKKFLTLVERAYLWVRGLPTIDKAMLDCDMNKDGMVCKEDIDASSKTCLPHCKAWNNMDTYVIQRAIKMEKNN
jgi:hypothetical protein